MEETKKNSVENQERPEKMSYEQLENIAHQLSEQNKQLYNQLQMANMTNMFKRLDYLFKVIENSVMFNDDFVERCTSEIEGTLTIPEEQTEEESNDTEA